MIKNFTDKDNKKYDLVLRSHYSSIKSCKKLIEVLENSTSIESLKKQYPHMTVEGIEKLHSAYSGKTYLEIMLLFGILIQSKLIK